ncbi:MAG: heme o synthase [Saprospiraceae bacterium]
MATETTVKNTTSIFGQKVADYQSLVKFRLTMTVVFSSVMAYLIAANGSIDWLSVGMLALGGFLVTGAANALNQVLEKDYDKLMTRTANRPLATGRMATSEAVLAAGLMSLGGITLLALFNPLTAFLGMVALLSYAYLYTPLKRVSPIAITVGAFPGALPTLIGCVAVEGQITMLGLSLFCIQFIWQFPHFWAIGWLGFDDYKKAGYKLIPTQNGERDKNTGLQSFIYALILVPLGVLPFYLGITGIVSAVIAVVFALAYAGMGWNLYQKCNRKAALQLMFISFFYIPVVFVAMYFDKI